MRTSEVDPKDYKYIIEKPDASFSPKRNKAIVQETINETTRFFKKLQDEIDDNLGERIEILGTYARYRFNRGDKIFDKYIGKQLRNKLIGEKILSKVRALESVDRLGRKDTRILL
jgi:hypothetical protein